MFDSRDNPFSFVTTQIEITNLYNFCKKYKNSYATRGYYLTFALNEIREFKYRYENGKFYYYDCINPSFTETYSDGTILQFSLKKTMRN